MSPSAQLVLASSVTKLTRKLAPKTSATSKKSIAGFKGDVSFDLAGIHYANPYSPNSMNSGLSVHHANKIKNGIQNIVNWIDKSISLPLAISDGGSNLVVNQFLVNQSIVTSASPEYETNGSKMRPNHSWLILLVWRRMSRLSTS
jgi:hypothetical protein